MNIISDNINEDFLRFIEENKNEESGKILFKYHGKPLPFSIKFAVLQLECRKKYRNKLTFFLNESQFIFPDDLAPEQASDQRVARYHAEVIGVGNKVLDMTAGLGIDAMSIAMHGNKVTAVELNPDKETILSHNANILGLNCFKSVCDDSIRFITQTSDKFDVVFIDPARRKDDNSRAYSFADCIPNVLKITDEIFRISPKLMIKASPLLDIHNILKEIRSTERIHIVCVKGECKEVLIEAGKDTDFQEVKIVDFKSDDSKRIVTFSKDELIDTKPRIISEDMLKAGQYLYEPVSGLMKITAYGALCKKFGLYKLSNNTSLYISDTFNPSFPGRVTKIEAIADKKLLTSIKGDKFNVVSRNYPLSADALRNKYRLKEGMDKFMYAFRSGEKETPIIVMSSKIS